MSYVTLRRVERGWKAKGRLAKFWKPVGGRDGLAALTGIQASTISGYNSGRLRLGLTNGKRIADALGVTILDLGAPTAEQAAEQSASLLDRLATVEEGLTQALREISELQRPRDDEE